MPRYCLITPLPVLLLTAVGLVQVFNCDLETGFARFAFTRDGTHLVGIKSKSVRLPYAQCMGSRPHASCGHAPSHAPGLGAATDRRGDGGGARML